jgi:hypothetical protein
MLRQDQLRGAHWRMLGGGSARTCSCKGGPSATSYIPISRSEIIEVSFSHNFNFIRDIQIDDPPAHSTTVTYS